MGRNEENINRKYVYAFLSPNGTTCMVNYDADNSAVNSFLALFDIWGSVGEFKESINGNAQEVWFEGTKSFFEVLKGEEFQKAFSRLGVTFTTEYPFEL